MSSGDAVTLPAPFKRRSCFISEREIKGPYVVIGFHDRDGPAPQPGQFYMLSEPHWGKGELARPFLPRACSVLRRGKDGFLQFLLEPHGPGTRRLCESPVGSELYVLGPLGCGFDLQKLSGRALLVGGGVGVAPLAILEDELIAAQSKSGKTAVESVKTLLGFRDRVHAAAAELFRSPQVASDDGSVGRQATVLDLLVSELNSIGTRDEGVTVFACGPPAMLEALRELCAARQVPAQVALESSMACGFGACFGCVVPTVTGYKRLCVEGPVLDATQLQRIHDERSSGADLSQLNAVTRIF